jgi:hypothetical protein
VGTRSDACTAGRRKVREHSLAKRMITVDERRDLADARCRFLDESEPFRNQLDVLEGHAGEVFRPASPGSPHAIDIGSQNSREPASDGGAMPRIGYDSAAP